MPIPDIARVLGAAAWTASVLLVAPGDHPAAVADPCPDSEVVFARGTGEPPGVGRVGQAFIGSLRAQVPGLSLGVYPVNYPASSDYVNSASAGANDASTYVENLAAKCPATKMVLGGYSQGAGVIDLATDSMPPQVANHVVAVALFGNPQSTYAKSLAGGQLPTISPLYRAKTIDLCVPGDMICSEGGSIVPHLLYVPEMTDQAAAFAASRLQPGDDAGRAAA
ncbi:MAG: cutinase family protein [Mycobacterium sp.]|uniref:cutinase family protein n=1 Tax=Mycobacterium sp. TaxID=1785 RepID=UPI002627939C|nr:cutinase family protein [Mycobacterium sp.]MDI3312924.1 cutinase family protein [Mycobacterium sp.]